MAPAFLDSLLHKTHGYTGQRAIPRRAHSDSNQPRRLPPLPAQGPVNPQRQNASSSPQTQLKPFATSQPTHYTTPQLAYSPTPSPLPPRTIQRRVPPPLPPRHPPQQPKTVPLSNNASVQDNSRDNQYQNHGEMSLSYGSTVSPPPAPVRIPGVQGVAQEAVATLDMPVSDNSSGNVYSNRGQMLHSYGNNNVNVIQHVQRSARETIFNRLARSMDAEFDMVTKAQRGPCAPNTRVEVLKDLIQWCRNPTGLLLYWMSGMAGTGKTTLVYTICQYLKATEKLLASFFCSRSLENCQDIYLVIPTLATQIAVRHESFAEKLEKVLEKDPDINKRHLDEQLLRLIIEPFKSAEQLPTDLVVVIDALDECKVDHTPFLEAIHKHASQLPFKLLLTSRPEYVIHKAMSTKEATSQTATFILHEVEKDIVRADIIKYLTHALCSLCPPPATIHLLADRSGSLFIYAATLARHVLEEDGDSEQRLHSLVAYLSKHVPNSITEPLDRLYTEILSRVFHAKGRLPQEVGDIRNLLHSVLCFREPLSKRDIAMIWGIEEGAVDRRLMRLRSVISIPADPAEAVTIFHASFLEFMLDSKRSGDLFCDANLFHNTLTMECFRLMNDSLHQNICNLEDHTPNDRIDPERLSEKVLLALSYACRHWATHAKASGSSLGANFNQEVKSFIFNHGLHWLECLAVIGQLPVAIDSLEILMKLVSEDTQLFNTARELHRLVQFSYDAIDHSGLEAYHSALTWVPLHSSLRSHYLSLWDTVPQPIRGFPTTWSGPDQIIDIRATTLESVTLSPDGSHIVSLSEQESLCVWNFHAHKMEAFIEADANCAATIAISSAQYQVILGTDKGLQIWDVAAHKLRRLDDETIAEQEILSLVVAPDGRRVYAALTSGNILVHGLGNSGSGPTSSEIYTSQPACCLTITGDGQHILFGSGHSLQIRGADSGKLIRELSGHEGDVMSVAVSPVNQHIITGSMDNTVKVWDILGQLLYTLKGHEEGVNAVAYFHHDLRAASGSEDTTIRVWDTGVGAMLAVLSGMPSPVTSIAIFPDDQRLVSGCDCALLTIWTAPTILPVPNRLSIADDDIDDEDRDDILNEGRLVAVSDHSICLVLREVLYFLDVSDFKKQRYFRVGEVDHLAVSSQGTHVITSSTTGLISDSRVQRWHVSRRKKGWGLDISESVENIIFSDDDQYVGLVLDDSSVQILSAQTGKQLHILHHQGTVRYAAFSHDHDDSQKMLTCTSSIVYVWNTSTGAQKMSFSLDGEDFCQVAFSPDNLHVIAISQSEKYDFFNDTTNSEFAFFAWNAESGELDEEMRDSGFCSVTQNGQSYIFRENGWMHCISDIDCPATPVVWVPSHFRALNFKGIADCRFKAFSSSEWDFISLENVEDQSKTITLRIPK